MSNEPNFTTLLFDLDEKARTLMQNISAAGGDQIDAQSITQCIAKISSYTKMNADLLPELLPGDARHGIFLFDVDRPHAKSQIWLSADGRISEVYRDMEKIVDRDEHYIIREHGIIKFIDSLRPALDILIARYELSTKSIPAGRAAAEQFHHSSRRT
jgi:hypothetical protein